VVDGVDVVGVGELVVVVGVAAVGAEVVFGFVVATDEPHPRATIPAMGIRATKAIRRILSMTPSRFCKRSSCVAGVWGDAPRRCQGRSHRPTRFGAVIRVY
jgi:hypothetical protein